MRFSFKSICPALTILSALLPGAAMAEGGFVSLQAGITDSQDMDSFGNAYKVHFGPNILENFALEFGLLDMGKAEYDDPTPTYPEVDNQIRPSFANAGHGDISRTSANSSNNEPAKATFTGLSSAHPQGFLITFRYKFALTDSLDFFVKTGANLWQAKLEQVELIATADKGPVQRRIISSNKKASAVDQITGGGFLWHPIGNLAVRAELETTALDSKDFERVRFQMITLGAQYEF